MTKREKLLEFINLARADLVHIVLGRERLTLEESRKFIKKCHYELMDVEIEEFDAVLKAKRGSK